MLRVDDEEQTAFRFGAGADFELGRRWRTSVDYLGEVGVNGQGHTVVAAIKLRL